MDASLNATACNEEQLIFEDACDDSNWMSVMQLGLDSIQKTCFDKYVTCQKVRMSLAPSGFIESKESQMLALMDIKPSLLQKVMHKNMALIMRRHLHLPHT